MCIGGNSLIVNELRLFLGSHIWVVFQVFFRFLIDRLFAFFAFFFVFVLFSFFSRFLQFFPTSGFCFCDLFVCELAVRTYRTELNCCRRTRT